MSKDQAPAVRPGCPRLLAEFIDRHRVKRFSYRYKDLQALFKQGGADNARVKDVLERCFDACNGMLGNYYGNGRPFDHVELWGRDQTPMMLIGHPYGISDEGRVTLEAIRGLGLVVSDYHPSWYGFGTCQVRAYYKPTVDRLIGRR
jgi:hypothetical protein